MNVHSCPLSSDEYPIYYYLALLQDVIFRFAWILEYYLKAFVISADSKILKEIVSTIFKSFEVFR